MDIPAFQPWTSWDDKYTADYRKRPGVYVLGRFENKPPGMVDPIDASVVYIGETCSQVLESRWYQFDRSAFQQKSGHSGGWTFAAQFCDNQIGVACPWLYVAALPVDFDEPMRSAYIRGVERLLIWKYVERHGRLPICNRK